MPKKNRLLSLALTVLIFTFPCGSFSKTQYEHKPVQVFYATNRASLADSFGPDRSYKHEDHGLNYGAAEVTQGAKTNWDVQIKEKLGSEEFIDALRDSMAKSKQKQIVIFVHGYNVNFENAVRSGAALETEMQCPVLVFDWCSRAKARCYTVDECNIEWSLRHFQLVMDRLEKSFPSNQLSTVSHSMGNRVVYWYLQSRHDRLRDSLTPYKEVVLTSPDVDRATFKNYFFKVAENAEKTRIYVSEYDKPLRLSKFVHLYSRLGDGRVGSTDTARWELPGDIKDTETINFTSLDEKDGGWLGHHIPFRLIASMHNSNNPGGGLALVAEDNQRPTYRTLNILNASKQELKQRSMRGKSRDE